MNRSKFTKAVTSLRKFWLLIFLGLTTAITIAVVNKSFVEPLIFASSFEEKNFSGWEQEFCCNHSAEVVDSPLRAGKHSVKFTLKKDDPVVEKGKRTELKKYWVGNMGSEYWYGFSIYLPNSWITDTAPEIVTQWHPRPDIWFGESGRSPTLTLSINHDNWGITNAWDKKVFTRKNDIEFKQILWSGPFNKGVWTDWVFHVKWTHKSDGLIEVWKDGVPIINKLGSSTYNDLLGPFFKIGIYKYPWKHGRPKSVVNERVLYFDQVRIGNDKANYNDVAPRT